MPFQVATSTLDSLEWERVADRLRTACRTPAGRLRLEELGAAGLFAATEQAVRARLAETSEARRLIDSDRMPPLGGISDLRTALARAAKGSVLDASELLDTRATLEALEALAGFFERSRDDSPHLSEIADHLLRLPELEREIARSLDASGEVRDEASPTLAAARREARSLAGDLQGRIERTLGDGDVRPHLSDHFYTVRNGRFVLPVKADAKGHVRGIVHDASRSGTTLFVEPDAMVELNNRHKQAELTVEREVRRVLRELSAAVAQEAEGLLTSLDSVAELDLGMARGRLSLEMEASEPVVEHEGIFELGGLRHPLLPANECVANDLRVGRDFSVLLLSGPNAGGKTVALKSVALAALFVRAGLHVPANPGARVDLVDAVLADIGDHQDIQESLSTFSAAMASLATILRTASINTLVCLDEIGVGTDPSEGAAIAQSALEGLADGGARVVTTTHYNLLKEMAEVDTRFENASVEFDPVTLAPTYRVQIGTPGASSATTVAARMGMPQSVLDRASTLLASEDRRLDRMLSELAASRATLEAEKNAAQALRLEGEQAREEYREKLSRLQERRDKLFGEMRADLDASFRDAHGEVARVIAELQRAPSSRRAAHARQRLETLESKTEEAQREQGLVPAPREQEGESTQPIDWPRARVGDPVLAPGGVAATLLALPDRQGRVRIQAGTARLTLARDQLGAAKGAKPTARKRESPRVTGVSMTTLGGTLEVDLRGLRVDESLDRLDEALDRAAAEGRHELRVIHGIGTGALRQAVRAHLPDCPVVIDVLDAAREDGGGGATRAVLRKD